MKRTPEIQRANSLRYRADDPRRQNPRRVTTEHIREIRTWYKRNWGADQIARHLRAMGMPLSPATIWRVLRRLGEKTRPRGSHWAIRRKNMKKSQ